MLTKGRSLISAPKGSLAANVTLSSAVYSAVDGLKSLDTKLTGTIAYNATTTSITVSSATGSTATANNVVIVGYGLPTAEEFTTTAAANSTSLTVVSANSKFAHAVGERVVAKVPGAPFRPGSVVVYNGSGVACGVDDGAGNMLAVNATSNSSQYCTGTVDYSSGVVSVKTGAAGSGNGTVIAESVPATASLEDKNGTGAYVNFISGQFGRRDIPDQIAVTNNGPSPVGVFIEKSYSDGRNFVKGGDAKYIQPGGMAVLKVDGGVSPTLDQVRIRAASALQTVTASTGARVSVTGDASTVDCDLLYNYSQQN